MTGAQTGLADPDLAGRCGSPRARPHRPCRGRRIPFLRFAGPQRIPELLDRIRAASAAAGRPADAVRAVYSVPVRLDPRARTTAGVVAGSAADVIEQLHGFTELGFTGFDLMPSRDQLPEHRARPPPLPLSRRGQPRA